MTITFAATDGDRTTWIGSDTLQGYGNGVTKALLPKWIHRDGCALGFAGAHRIVNIIEHNWADLMDGPPTPYELSQRMRSLFSDNGVRLERGSGEEGPECFGGEFLLARPGSIWLISTDFCTIEVPDFWAIGTGRDLAIGAAHAITAMRHGGGLGASMVRAAVSAAIAYEDSCGGDVWTRTLVR